MNKTKVSVDERSSSSRVECGTEASSLFALLVAGQVMAKTEHLLLLLLLLLPFLFGRLLLLRETVEKELLHSAGGLVRKEKKFLSFYSWFTKHERIDFRMST